MPFFIKTEIIKKNT